MKIILERPGGKSRLDYTGLLLNKRFNDGWHYFGKVVSGPHVVIDDITDEPSITWKVLYYYDHDTEDLTQEEIKMWKYVGPKDGDRTRGMPKWLLFEVPTDDAEELLDEARTVPIKIEIPEDRSENDLRRTVVKTEE